MRTILAQAMRMLLVLYLATLCAACLLLNACQPQPQQDTNTALAENPAAQNSDFKGSLETSLQAELSALFAELEQLVSVGQPNDASKSSSASSSPSTDTFDNATLPEGFSYVKLANPNIRVDLRYATTNNFTGFVVDGYHNAQAAILREPAVAALSKAQKQLEKSGLGLLIYDAYRPQKAAHFFVAWSLNDDERMKDQYYPKLAKSSLHSLGYIAEYSGHSQGTSVDVTLVDLATGTELDMGSPFDLFDEISWHDSQQITAKQAQNRALLKTTLEQCGFTSFYQEWWHYTYNNFSYPSTYFDFDVA